MRFSWPPFIATYLLIAVLAIAEDVRLQVTVVPAYQVTIWVGGRQFVARGTGAVKIRVPAGLARIRVIKSNSASPRFRLESNGAELLKSELYGSDLETTIPGDPGRDVELALKTD